MAYIATIVLALIGLRLLGGRGLLVFGALGYLLDRGGWSQRIARAALRGVRVTLGDQAPPHPAAQGEPARDAYATLGLDPSRRPSDEQIREAYRRLAQQYHPDRVSHLAPEFRELAERKFREIKAARDLLLGER